MPVIYYVRHGETDWNVEWRLQGGRDIALNERGRAQAMHCAGVLRDLLARDRRLPSSLDYVCSPLSRARVTMDLIRNGLGLPPEGYRIERQLTEISFGEWEGFTLEELARRDGESVRRRDRDKWNFLPPGGESYQQLMVRVAEWYATLSRDAVVVAHGGTARALFAHLGIFSPATAAQESVEQGVVYVVADGQLARYD
ncbi:MAG TPA: histidine phosphatase family protein [Pseudorhodoplanes sp.]|nr:histidine phosphatase family protein [Pseudorhodoplanes sp.]